jgi:hypothetical protein
MGSQVGVRRAYEGDGEEGIGVGSVEWPAGWVKGMSEHVGPM